MKVGGLVKLAGLKQCAEELHHEVFVGEIKGWEHRYKLEYVLIEAVGRSEGTLLQHLNDRGLELLGVVLGHDTRVLAAKGVVEVLPEAVLDHRVVLFHHLEYGRHNLGQLGFSLDVLNELCDEAESGRPNSGAELFGQEGPHERFFLLDLATLLGLDAACIDLLGVLHFMSPDLQLKIRDDLRVKVSFLLEGPVLGVGEAFSKCLQDLRGDTIIDFLLGA